MNRYELLMVLLTHTEGFNIIHINNFKIKMSSSIIEIISQCSYPLNVKDYIANVLLDLSLQSPTTTFYKTTQGNEDIIAFKYNIQTLFKEKKFDIPIIIYLPKNFPHQAPEVYIDKSSDTGINPRNTNIDPNTSRFQGSTQKDWKVSSQLGDLIAEITNSFNAQFPIYKLNSMNSSLYPNGLSQPKQVNTIYSDVGIKTNNSYSGFNRSNTINTSTEYSSVRVNQSYHIPQSYNTQSIINQYVDPSSVGQSKVNSIGIHGGVHVNNSNSYQKTNTINNTYNKALNDIFNSNSSPSINNVNNQEANIKDSKFHEDLARKVLIEEIKLLVEPKVKEELKRLKQQETKLKNYHTEFTNQVDRYQKLLYKRDEITMSLRKLLNDIESHIQVTLSSIAKSQDRLIMQHNAMNFININEKDEKLLHIITIEATIEDIITVLKKAFEKGIINFSDNVKLIRNITRELFRIKYYRDRL
jgi:hypothetical protein